jgi:hypothetical protein
MGSDLPVATLVDFIVGDFEAAWGALVIDPKPGHRGNFFFGLQAVVLLEVASRLCASDASGMALSDFSSQLHGREPRYFTALPGACVSQSSEFTLPFLGPDPSGQLIAALFDLIRNGQAHQYQQIRVRLNDGTDFQVSLTGAEVGRILGSGTREGHLGQSRDSNGDLWLKVRTDTLFMDIRDSIRAANLLGRGLTFAHLLRPRRKAAYSFSGAELERALAAGGH